jgi:hypothetical protein
MIQKERPETGRLAGWRLVHSCAAARITLYQLPCPGHMWWVHCNGGVWSGAPPGTAQGKGRGSTRGATFCLLAVWHRAAEATHAQNPCHARPVRKVLQGVAGLACSVPLTCHANAAGATQHVTSWAPGMFVSSLWLGPSGSRQMWFEPVAGGCRIRKESGSRCVHMRCCARLEA